MKITDHKAENAFGYQVTYRLYEPNAGSNDYVIFLHGIGERGPIDGSKLSLLEKNHGFPRSAAEGFEFPFNIVAVQVPDSYSQMKKFILPYVKFKYNAEHIFVTGLSLGGMATYEMLTQDDYNLIDGAAPVCGRLSATLAAGMKEYKIKAYHGDKDTTVAYGNDLQFVNAYNATHINQIVLTTYPGVGHNAWDYAYSLEPGKDDLYQFALQIFSIPKPSYGIEVFKEKVINLIKTLQ